MRHWYMVGEPNEGMSGLKELIETDGTTIVAVGDIAQLEEALNSGSPVAGLRTVVMSEYLARLEYESVCSLLDRVRGVRVMALGSLKHGELNRVAWVTPSQALFEYMALRDSRQRQLGGLQLDDL